jgi:hypothetical protein
MDWPHALYVDNRCKIKLWKRFLKYIYEHLTLPGGCPLALYLSICMLLSSFSHGKT